ncbi:MAG: Xaa-Pro peptidase family protein, partial [Thaumarchaeota archaeon]|nr:Xaa-Pro peptidase family protein [Nitrososphaerota archaeon]
MSQWGFSGVDWEDRINFERLRKERLQKSRDALAESDADVLLILRPEDIRYVVGFRSHMGPVGYYGSHVLVLGKDADPVLYTMDSEFAKNAMGWMKEGTIVGPRPWRSYDGVAIWAEDLKRRLGRIPKKIGVDVWEFGVETRLRQAFANSEFVDGKEILYKAKIIKTRDEIACLKAAYAISEAGLKSGLSILRPGIRECEVLAEIWKTMTALGSEWTQCSNIVASGPYTAPYRRFTSDRVIQEGDLVIIDIGGCFNGYWGDLTRTVVCGDGEPTPQQKELAQECYDSLFSACGAAKPGNSTWEVSKHLTGRNSWGLSSGHGSGTGPWEPP